MPPPARWPRRSIVCWRHRESGPSCLRARTLLRAVTPASATLLIAVLAPRKSAAERAIAVAAKLRGPAAAAAVTGTETVLAIVVRLANREFGIGTGRGGRAFGPRKRCPYQAAVHRPFVGDLEILPGRFRLVVLIFAVVRGLGHRGRRRLVGVHRLPRLRGLGVRRLRRVVVQLGNREPLRGERGGRLGLAANAGDLRLFVLVVGVARRAPRLLDVVADHGDDHVIGHAAFTRAIVIQNVTKPRLALLHQNSRTEPLTNPRREGEKVRRCRHGSTTRSHCSTTSPLPTVPPPRPPAPWTAVSLAPPPTRAPSRARRCRRRTGRWQPATLRVKASRTPAFQPRACGPARP